MKMNICFIPKDLLRTECLSPNSYAETLLASAMVLGGAVYGRQFGMREKPAWKGLVPLLRRDTRGDLSSTMWGYSKKVLSGAPQSQTSHLHNWEKLLSFKPSRLWYSVIEAKVAKTETRPSPLMLLYNPAFSSSPPCNSGQPLIYYSFALYIRLYFLKFCINRIIHYVFFVCSIFYSI